MNQDYIDTVRLLLEPVFSNAFVGMTREEITLKKLEQTQALLIAQLPGNLTPVHREFLLSLVRAEPAWDLMPFKQLQNLPALQWKLLNLRKLKSRNASRFAAQSEELVTKFGQIRR